MQVFSLVLVLPSVDLAVFGEDAGKQYSKTEKLQTDDKIAAAAS